MLAFSLIMILVIGIMLIELLVPVVILSKLDAIGSNYSEQVALLQDFSPEMIIEMEATLSEAGLIEIDITLEPLSTLKRGERAMFIIKGAIKGKRLFHWSFFETHYYRYQFERSILCKNILN